LTTRWGTSAVTLVSFKGVTEVRLEVFLHAGSLLLINLYLLEEVKLTFALVFLSHIKLAEDTPARLLGLVTVSELFDNASVICIEGFFGIVDEQAMVFTKVENGLEFKRQEEVNAEN